MNRANTQLQVSMLSHAGGRPVNEDACGYRASSEAIASCFVLADGAGGHGGGRTAARLAVQTVLEAARPVVGKQPATATGLLKAAHQSVISAQSHASSLSDMRTTIVVLLLDAQRQLACWCHAGDSRLYCFEDKRLISRTRDHSLVESLEVTSALGSTARTGDSLRHVLTRALGGPGDLEPPDAAWHRLTTKSSFLLCSDGFWSRTPDELMSSTLAQARSPQDWLEAMEATFLQSVRDGWDNYSALAVWFRAGLDGEQQRTSFFSEMPQA